MNHAKKEVAMFNRNRDRNRKLATLAGLGLSVALLRGRWRRYAVARMMMGGGFGSRGWGRYGGYGPSVFGDPSQPLPPFIEARLKAWHDRAHGNSPSQPSQPTDTAQV